MPAELYTFHEAVSQLQDIEDDVLDTHKTFIDMQHDWLQRSTEILKRTKEVDFDQDGNYVTLAQTILQLTVLPFLYVLLYLCALPYFCDKI